LSKEGEYPSNIVKIDLNKSMNSLGSVNCNESRKWEWNLI
jgi:hypothetical protein